MSKLNLDRTTLAMFLPNHQAIVAFERVLEDVGNTMPSTIEEANANAVTAIALAQEAFSALVDVAGALAQLLAVPAQLPQLEPDDMAPRLQIGTIASQNSDAVEITGGTIDGAVIGGSAPAAISGTTITATTGLITALKGATLGITIGDVATNNGSALRMQGTSAGFNWLIDNNTIAAALSFTPSAAAGGVTYTTPTMSLTPGAVSITGTLTPSGAFGCNSKAAQTAAASGGAMATTAATNAAPYGFTTAAQADSIATKINAIQAALIANGIMS